MIGKVRPEDLAEIVFTRTGASDPDVLQGPAYGEDTAALDLGDEVLVLNSDPISLAVDRIGQLGVNVACNDVAASGARPRWLNNVVFLPPTAADETFDRITRQLDEAAAGLDVAIVGGHSEYAPEVSQPMLVLTCLGLTDRYVATGGAEPGDRIVLTKAAGIEATAIVASDFRDRLDGVPEDVVERGLTFYDEMSVVPDAEVVTPYAHAMHDPTEGGLIDGLLELAAASGVALSVDRAAIPVRPETRTLCAAVGVDPLRTFGSGSLVAAVAPEDADEVVAKLRAAGIEATVVGEALAADEPRLELGGEVFTEAVRDDMYALWE
jgi:hydrogenase expression/formation protein HypE